MNKFNINKNIFVVSYNSFKRYSITFYRMVGIYAVRTNIQLIPLLNTQVV